MGVSFFRVRIARLGLLQYLVGERLPLPWLFRRLHAAGETYS